MCPGAGRGLAWRVAATKAHARRRVARRAGWRAGTALDGVLSVDQRLECRDWLAVILQLSVVYGGHRAGGAAAAAQPRADRGGGDRAGRRLFARAIAEPA